MEEYTENIRQQLFFGHVMRGESLERISGRGRPRRMMMCGLRWWSGCGTPGTDIWSETIANIWQACCEEQLPDPDSLDVLYVLLTASKFSVKELLLLNNRLCQLYTDRQEWADITAVWNSTGMTGWG